MKFSIENESILNHLQNYTETSINLTGYVFTDNNILFKYSVDSNFEINRVLNDLY